MVVGMICGSVASGTETSFQKKHFSDNFKRTLDNK